MKIEIKEVFENYFVFTIDNQDIRRLKRMWMLKADCWLAIDYLDGITAEGKSRVVLLQEIYIKF